MTKIIRTIAAAAIATGFVVAEDASALEAGDTIRILVGFSAGGGYDTEARMAAPHIESQLHDMGYEEVNVIVENVTGGAGAIATGQIYSAEPDGTTLGYFAPATSIWQETLMGAPFRVGEFSYLGQQSLESYALAVLPEADISTFDEFVERSQEQPILMGTSGRGAYSDHIFPELMALVLAENGTDVNFEYLHLGGTGEVMASMRRGEAEGFMAGLTPFLKFVEDGNAEFLFTFGDTEWPNAKEVLDLPEDDYAMLKAAGASQRVWVAPPDMEPELLEDLRTAIETAVNSEEFLEQANAANRPVTFIDGASVGSEVSRAVDLALQYGDQIRERIEQ